MTTTRLLLISILGLLITLSAVAVGGSRVDVRKPAPRIIAGSNILYSGPHARSTLPAGKLLTIAEYTLTMEESCNLALYIHGDCLVWETGTGGMGYNGCDLVLVNNGKLMIYHTASRTEVWASGKGSFRIGNYVLVLQRDRNLVIYGPATWASGTKADTVAEVQPAANMLYSRDQLQSTLRTEMSLTLGSYALTLQPDCNLQLYDGTQLIWETQTSWISFQSCYLTLLRNGDLVIRDWNTGTELWSSGSGGEEGRYVFILQEDRNMVIYGPVFWESGTHAFSIAQNRKMGAAKTALAA